MYVPQLLEDVPQIRSKFSGFNGFKRHFDEMLGEDLKGLDQLIIKHLFFCKLGPAYMEAVACGPLQGMLAFHGYWYRYKNQKHTRREREEKC